MTAGEHQPIPPAETSPAVSIHVTSPACLLSVIPRLLGFQPVNISAQFYGNAAYPTNGSPWSMRLSIAFLFPKMPPKPGGAAH